MSSQTEKIENIIKNISKTEIRTLTQIKDLNNEAVDDIFSDFIGYPRNSENKFESLDELKEYQLIHYSDLYKGDKVAYFKTRDFWNIKLITGTVVGQNKKGEYSVKLKGNKTVYVLPKYIFRKLTDEEKFKIQLIEAVFTM
tara:strand:- start:628 stop:1050 length:423 start_codon:yes stop_codon:yes gene_type:complete